MALDPYQPCPCGAGKKIKFCCSKDIVSELDKVVRAVQGEQRVAGLDQIKKLIKEKGPRPALLALQAEVQLALGSIEDADATIDEFLGGSPDNPVALSLSALHACLTSDVESAVEDLQQALEQIDNVVPHATYNAIGAVAQLLLAQGNLLAARGHLLLQAGLAGESDDEAFRLLMRINIAPELPLLLKQDFSYAGPPADVEWSDEFQAALQLASHGAWLAACEAFDSLDEKYPDQSAILKNIGILSGWLGQNDEATIAWRKYSTLSDVPVDDAVEAAALAQMLDPEVGNDQIDSVLLTFTVADADQLVEQFRLDPRVASLPVDPSQLANEDQPPPKAAFWLLDRAVPESGEDLEVDQIPNLISELYLYGRQTDREARLELSLLRDEHFEERKQLLIELAGPTIGGEPTEQVEGQVSKLMAAMTWRWRLPDDTPPQRRRELTAEHRREVMLNRWPDLTLHSLGGQTPRQAAADPDKKIPTLAAILLLELSNAQDADDFDFNELRRELDLPTRDEIDPAGVAPDSISLLQLPLLQAEKLPDDILLLFYRASVLKHVPRAMGKMATEVLRRDSLKDKVDRNEAYNVLIRTATDSDEALRYVAEAQEYAAQTGESPAKWLLAELSIRLPRLESDHCQRLVQTLQTRHANEPGVAQGLYDILVSYGLISPDGTPVQSPGGAPPAAAAAPPAATEPASAIWTPDSPEPAARDQQKSKLWVPGMD